MSAEQSPWIFPFSDPYFQRAREREASLLKAPALGKLLNLDVVDKMQGGMGEILVVRGRDSDGSPELSVLKMVRSEDAGSSMAMAQIADEALSMQRAKMEACLEIQGVHRPPFQNRLYIQLPFCAGGSLRDRIKSGRMSTEEFAHHVLFIGIALCGLHRRKISHRDLKPGNVLLWGQAGRQDWVPMVADFGLATLISSKGRVRGFEGTPLYASPEHLMGAAPSTRMDVWALGVIASELWTGRHPYGELAERALESGGCAELGAKLAAMDFSYLYDGPPFLPAGWADVFKSCLSYEAGQRPEITRVVDALSERISFGSTKEGLIAGVPPEKSVVNLDDELLYSSLASGARRLGLRGIPMLNGKSVLRMKLGWPNTVKNAQTLMEVRTPPALWEAVRLIDDLLGSWEDAESPLGQFQRDPPFGEYSIPGADDPAASVLTVMTKLPSDALLTLLAIRCNCLIHLSDTGQQAAVRELHETAQRWLRVGVFESASELLSDAGPPEKTSEVEPGQGDHVFSRMGLVAQGFILAGDFTTAVGLLGKILDQRPNHIQARCTFYFLAIAMREYELAFNLAVSVARESMGGAKDFTAVWMLHAIKALVEGRSWGDLATLITKISPDFDPEAAACRIITLAHTGSLVETDRKSFQQVLAWKRDFAPRTRRFLAEAAWCIGDREAAVDLSREALSDPRLYLPQFQQYARLFENILEGDPRFDLASGPEGSKPGADGEEKAPGNPAPTEVQRVLGDAEALLKKGDVPGAFATVDRLRKTAGGERVSDLLAMVRRIGAGGRRTEFRGGWRTHLLEGYDSPLAIWPDGSRALVEIDGTHLGILDLATGKQLKSLTVPAFSVAAVVLTEDGKKALSTHNDHEIRLWDLESEACLRTLKGHTDDVYCAAATPDGRLALTGGRDEAARLWDLQKGECVATLKGHRRAMTSVALRWDGLLAASSSGDNTLRVWDLRTGECTQRIAAEHLESYAVEFMVATPDLRLALTGGYTGMVRLWDLKSGTLIRELAGHQKGPRGIAITPDGCWGLSGSWDKSLRLWDLQTGRCRWVQEDQGAFRDSGLAVALDGTRVIGALGGKLGVWELDWGYDFPPSTLEDKGLRAWVELFISSRRARASEDLARSGKSGKSASPSGFLGKLTQGLAKFVGRRSPVLALTEQDLQELVRWVQWGNLGWVNRERLEAELKKVGSVSFAETSRGGMRARSPSEGSDSDSVQNEHTPLVNVQVIDLKEDSPEARNARIELESALEESNRLFRQGNSKLEEGDFACAIGLYDRALAIYSGNVPALGNRGTAKQEKGDFDGAIRDFAEIIRQRPSEALAYCNRGNAFRAKNEFTASIADYEKAIEIDPGMAAAWCNCGIARSALGDHDRAMEDFDHAVELRPREPVVLKTRGLARVKLGDYRGAIEDFTRAIEAEPRDADAYVTLGRTWGVLGDLNRAEQNFIEALRIAPAHRGAREGLDLIRRQKNG